MDIDDDPIGTERTPGFGELGAILLTSAPLALIAMIAAVYYLWPQ